MRWCAAAEAAGAVLQRIVCIGEPRRGVCGLADTQWHYLHWLARLTRARAGARTA